VVQAEEGKGVRVLGLKKLDGTFLAGLEAEFQLLGRDRPVAIK